MRNICRNVRNGDCPKNGDEWHTPVPNEDFGKRNSASGVCFREIFRLTIASRSTHTLEKTRPTCCFVFQNLCLGSVKSRECSHIDRFDSPVDVISAFLFATRPVAIERKYVGALHGTTPFNTNGYDALSLWRTKKSHFRPSDEKSMKNVDKDAVNTTIGLICYLDA